jgi:hypothetical protein
VTGKKLSDLNAENEISIPDNEYRVMIDDDKKEVYVRARMMINPDEGNSASVKITKRSSGRNRLDAIENAERLQYVFDISGNKLTIDEFCTIPSDSRWSFDELWVTVNVPEGTILYMDRTAESMFHSWHDNDFVTDSKNRLWRMTDDGLDYIEP